MVLMKTTQGPAQEMRGHCLIPHRGPGWAWVECGLSLKGAGRHLKPCLCATIINLIDR